MLRHIQIIGTFIESNKSNELVHESHKDNKNQSMNLEK